MSGKPKSDAVEGNEKLFRKFAALLSSPDIAIFEANVAKVAMWLRDARAYYPQARPKVSFPIDFWECSEGKKNAESIFR